MKHSKAPILITGAAQRVGLYCIQQWLGAGQPVIMTYRRRHAIVDELEQSGVVCLYADFSDETGIHNFIELLRSQVTELRAIVHNASEWTAEAESPGGALQRAFSVHMLAPYLINQSCADLLCSHDGGDIVHITDYVAERGSDKHLAYAASKAGLQNMTLSFAKMLAPQIKVNSVAPSLLMFHRSDSAEYRERTLAKSVLGIEPGAVVVFEAINFILASSYMTGRTIALDGGRHLKF